MAEKILIVDDDIDNLKLIALMLQRAGYEVVKANAGNQALAKAVSDHPDLIILDVMMPDMNGYEVCRRLRSNSNTQRIPIIMFTAKTLIDDKVAGFEAGADDYLTKPTHPAELTSRVKAILARGATERSKDSNKGGAIGVLGAKGGVGTTTVALNLAAALLQTGEQPIAADFRLGAGSMGLFLGLGRAQSMFNILNKPVNEIRPPLVENEIVTHNSGLRVLLSSSRPKEAQLIVSQEAALTAVKAIRALAKPAVFDLGSGYAALTHRIHRDMTRLILVVEPNRPTLSMARELIQEMGSDGERINIVVVNRAQANVQTPWHEVEQILGQEIKGSIAPAPEIAFQAIETGTPMVLLQPSSIVATQIMKLSETINMVAK